MTKKAKIEAIQKMVEAPMAFILPMAIQHGLEIVQEEADWFKKTLEERSGLIPYLSSRNYNSFYEAHGAEETRIVENMTLLSRKYAKTIDFRASLYEFSQSELDRQKKLTEQSIRESFYELMAKKAMKIFDDNPDGEIESIELQAGGSWDLTVLLVNYSNGDTICWRTRVMINVSKYGKLFNQWRTQKIK